MACGDWALLVHSAPKGKGMAGVAARDKPPACRPLGQAGGSAGSAPPRQAMCRSGHQSSDRSGADGAYLRRLPTALNGPAQRSRLNIAWVYKDAFRNRRGVAATR